jgi:hypothetical protein
MLGRRLTAQGVIKIIILGAVNLLPSISYIVSHLLPEVGQVGRSIVNYITFLTPINRF